MFFSDNVFLILCLSIAIFQVHSDKNIGGDDTVSEMSDEIPTDNYLFVALIDVVFTDGSKRTCTGTIIHDNVVITAAHCFSIEDSMQPELTASFVVIGTKKMFETGYEQYLPIERVIIHPKYRGWTADLALVYTFAGMMSDKPGRVVRLANEKTNTDSEVTVFSWGQCKDENTWGTNRPETETKTETPYEASLSDDEKLDDINNQKESGKDHKTTSGFEDEQDMDTKTTRHETINFEDQNDAYQHHKKKRNGYIKRRKPRKKQVQITVARAFVTRKLQRTISSIEENFQSNRHRKPTYENVPDFESKEYKMSREKRTKYSNQVRKKSAVADKRMNRRRAYRMKSHYRNNWRRKIGDQKNKLTVDVFSFVNTQSCKKLVEKAMPSLYKIKNPNEILCYSSEDHYITQEDSGAPAMRQGRLVAVTVGGIDYEGERVAVGMKIICFCSWIAENLPKSGSRIKCCKNCCEIKDNGNQGATSLNQNIHRKKHRNKYISI